MYKKHILICAGTGCISSGANKVRDALVEELTKHNMHDEVRIVMSGCHGFCEKGPIFIVYPEDIFYNSVTVEDVQEIVSEHLINGNVVERLLYKDLDTGEAIKQHHNVGFYKYQKRYCLRNCGVIDPENIDDYIVRGGYIGLAKTLKMDRFQVVEEVKKSGLRGRGGGGFPTGLKWEFTYKAEGEKKYVVCNADEGDPGAFMDRSILEGDPHAVIEGMSVAAYAVGADEAYVYVRAEYPLAIKRLRSAIKQAEEYGMLGENILGSGFNFILRIKEGAGAFVCGEETALLTSIEGNRGMPRPRPPFPAQSGLWGKPTCLNNVETFANVPLIMRRGADWYSSIGTEGSKGTKVFALTGKINNTGLAEVPMGMSLRDIIFKVAGGIQNDKKFKAVQIGGPSGGCIPEEELDLPVDFDSLTAAGSMMGSGGLVVMDETTCMVDLAKFFLDFTQIESCGKCTPCREGTKRMLEILQRITGGEGKEGDIEALESLAVSIKEASLCGLGQTAPNPVLSTLRYFRDEYEKHIYDRTCPAGVCTALISYTIDAELCNGCGRCRKICPVSAITGGKKEVHVVDKDACIRCGQCIEKCKFNAIVIK
ncbi:NADH-quinone oxidoreductase subunit NuoF [Candidatus Contubernalis alkaliaceticus]|uniref:NADH-quinone oxidoreductase subunit NuoF n=1 Tax=Candidatus Contubernalis alkaliaceticus TaxID=338645 RepID=UPI001F4BE03A|nr:NADH-quinone oxidoreductase subunit NuoF [Candidatus Contubernalis alkalaceticus]UNC91480.1 NADH-quinone oxidoreductase subunit NuoF [Candidatus Contubernalis alkalaceticus]